MKQDTLVEEIEQFLRESGMEPTMFGHRVQREWKLVERLRAGGDVTTRTANKIREFISENRQSAPRPKRQRPAAHV